MKALLLAGIALLSMTAYGQTSGFGQPSFPCHVNDTYQDNSFLGVSWKCGPSDNSWAPTPAFQPWGGSGGAYLPLTGGTLTGPLGIAITGGGAGYFSLTQGTAPGSTPANSITFLSPTSVTAYTMTFPGTAPTSNGQTLSCTIAGVCTWASGGGGSVSSVANSDGSLTISPTTGAVVASLNPAHANSWSATQNYTGNSGAGGFSIFPLSGNAYFQMAGTSGDTWQLFADSLASGHNHKFGFYNVTQTVEPFSASGGTSGQTWFGLPTVGGLGWTTQSQFPDNDTTLATAFWLVNNTGSVVSLGNGTAGDGSGTLKLAAILPGVIYSAAGTALPTCVTGLKGQRAVVGDATSPTYLGTYTSGGAIVTQVLCNGSTWVTD